MRVVAGTARGRRLSAPPGTGTRPTTDRVREATFNALGSLGGVAGAVVLDGFAGSGALGIEALSRGAERCTFVERDREAIATLKANIQKLGAEGADVRAQAAEGFAGGPFDLVFMDPPYHSGLALKVLPRLTLETGAWISIETAFNEDVEVQGFVAETARNHGKAKLTLLRLL